MAAASSGAGPSTRDGSVQTKCAPKLDAAPGAASAGDRLFECAFFSRSLSTETQQVDGTHDPIAARHEALNAQAAKRWQRALDAALAGRATSSSLSPPPLRRRDEADALSDDEFEDPFPAGIESTTAVPAY